MSSFLGLLRKDFYLMRFWYLVWLVLLLLVMIGSFSLAEWISIPSAVVPFLIVLTGFQFLLMPLMIMSVLRVEGKTQLWLYNPQSSAKLILSKLTIGIIFQLVSQFLIGIYGLIIINYLLNEGQILSINQFLTFKVGFIFEIGILASSIYMSVWVVFLWTIYHSLGKYPTIRNFRWLAVILVLFLYNLSESLLLLIKPFQSFIGMVKVELNILPKLNYEQQGWNITYTESPFPLIPIILYFLLTIIIFFIASKLLDRKVEV